MPEQTKTNNKAADAAIAQYNGQIEQLADRALSGAVTEREYIDEHERLSKAAILMLFLLGGGDPNSKAGAAYLREQYEIAKKSTRNLASDLFDGRYSKHEEQTAEEGRDSLFTRLLLWLAVLGRSWHMGHTVGAVPIGMVKVGTWKVGPTEHCSTCLSLNGQTKTSDEWARLAYLGIQPQGTGLECGGYNCQCTIDWELVPESEWRK